MIVVTEVTVVKLVTVLTAVTVVTVETVLTVVTEVTKTTFFFTIILFSQKKRLFFTQKFHIKTFFSPIIFFY